MITPGAVNYDVVLQGKYFLREAVTQITLEDRLGEIACRTTLNLTVPGDQFTGLPIIKPGQEIHVIGAPFGNDKITDILVPALFGTCKFKIKRGGIGMLLAMIKQFT